MSRWFGIANSRMKSGGKHEMFFGWSCEPHVFLDSNIDAFYQWFRRRRRYWCGHKGILKLCLSFVISSVAPMCAMGKYLGAAMCSEEGSIQMKADRLHRIYGNKKFECISL